MLSQGRHGHGGRPRLDRPAVCQRVSARSSREALPAFCLALDAGFPVETAIIFSYIKLLARHPDTLIARKYGLGTGA